MPHHCLIVEPTPLIARDLALSAQEYGLSPVIVATDGDALNWLAEYTRPESAGSQTSGAQLTLAFVHQGAEAFANSPLHRQLAGLQVRIVLMGSEGAAARGTASWSNLDWPFTTAHVSALLKAMGLRRPEGCDR